MSLDPFFGFLVTGDGYFWLANSDPVVAMDRQGFMYVAHLDFDVFDNGNGLYIGVAPLGSALSVGGILPVDVHPRPFTNAFAGKPWLAVDDGKTPTTVGTV